MLVIGLTGGIGSGKTTVGKLFERLGATVIDSDQLSRNVTLPNRPALNQIVEHFGEKILQKDGSLDRTALRNIIFKNENERIWLEKLLHPLIRKEMKDKIQSADSLYCIIIIPLLLETEPNPLIQRILVIDSPESEQIKRTQTRDRSTPDEIKAIINTQVNRKKRLLAAHDVIINDGSLEDLAPQVERLHGFYSALAKKNL